MNIAVYCGSVTGNDEAFTQAAIDVGTWIAENGHTLVYGGGHAGLMGIVADTILEKGGKVIGVIPDVVKIREEIHRNVTELIEVESMSIRKQIMMDKSDAFIALPGGPGTIDEISEIIVNNRISVFDKPGALYNVKGYYDPFQETYEKMREHGFLGKDEECHILFSDDLLEIEEYLCKKC